MAMQYIYEYRKEKGLQPIATNDVKIKEFFRQRAIDQAYYVRKTGKSSHEGYDAYQADPVLENLGAVVNWENPPTSSSAKALVNQWRNSPAHNEIPMQNHVM